MKQLNSVTKLILSGLIFLSGCSSLDFTEDNLSTEPMPATLEYVTAFHEELVSIPPPEEKIVVAVYKFRDQSGQYKTSSSATTFSTAVTQGATSMLIKALEDSGWFVPIEREGIANLLNERKIVRSSRIQYESESGESMPELPPLLYAGVLLEGGIVSYDTNFITGGAGLRYFGVGGSGQFRKDRVAIYLRLVSVKNGEILKTVSTTKSILSKEVDFNVYRFVSVEKLFEAETGFSTNEPPSMCVLEAIEKAVFTLVVEGIEEGLWGLKNPQDINSPVIQTYFEERKQRKKMIAFNKKGHLIEVQDVQQEEEPESVLSYLDSTVKELSEDENSGTEIARTSGMEMDEVKSQAIPYTSASEMTEVAKDTDTETVDEHKQSEPSTENINIVTNQFIIKDLGEPGTELIGKPEMVIAGNVEPVKRRDESESNDVVVAAQDTHQAAAQKQKAVISYLHEIAGPPNSQEAKDIGIKFNEVAETMGEKSPVESVAVNTAKKEPKKTTGESQTVVAEKPKSENDKTIFEALRGILGMNREFLTILSTTTPGSSAEDSSEKKNQKAK
ncbi:MAG: hypothetical protein JXM79_09560 [Sedimentisphaerales bacterium]|nr:hypothetical protein [Sedimentisphaerales bacterium]